MQISSVVYPLNRAEWRAWLEANHQSETEVWVRTFRKASGMPCITYDELVEECLCFGWIDGAVKKYDEDSMVQRTTPRRKKIISVRTEPPARVETTTTGPDDACGYRRNRAANRFAR